MESVENLFRQIGGTFLTKPARLQQKTEKIQGFLFDWDGVFNSGIKSHTYASTYSEIDSMGINLLRFSYWLKTATVPFTGIITGQYNESAFELSKREHFNSVYFNFKSKNEALEQIAHLHNIKPSQILFVYDDVLDISIAKKCGLSVLINRKSSPLLTKYVKDNDVADYITGHKADENAIREICELIMGLNKDYETVLNERIAFSEKYQTYLEERNNIVSKFYHKSDKRIIETSI
jgi:3-deoxy-D-manno-octulosonate 8-phosphate phosphatase (KDO 8-P phosphatase)